MTSLIFHYIPFSVTTHIYTCRSIHKPQSVNPGLEHNHSSLDRIYKILGAENHRTRNHVQTHEKNMGGSAYEWVRTKKKKLAGALPRTPTMGTASPLVTPQLRPMQHPARGDNRGKNITHTQHDQGEIKFKLQG